MAKQPRTFESNLDYVTEKLKENPHRAMNLIGQQLVREIRPKIPKSPVKGGKFQNTVSYWARKGTQDIQIGFYDPARKPNAAEVWPETERGLMTGTIPDPIKETVLKNADLIQKIIGEALDQIRKGK